MKRHLRQRLCGKILCDIWQNDQWRIVGLLTVFNILAVCVRGGRLCLTSHGFWARRKCLSLFSDHLLRGNLIGSALENLDRLVDVSHYLLVDERPAGGD
ncbi:hypothetical protein ACVXHB_25935 [Escherichia coli]